MGGVVLDPQEGSGTTGVATGDHGSRVGIEREPYFDIACRRIEGRAASGEADRMSSNVKYIKPTHIQENTCKTAAYPVDTMTNHDQIDIAIAAMRLYCRDAPRDLRDVYAVAGSGDAWVVRPDRAPAVQHPPAIRRWPKSWVSHRTCEDAALPRAAWIILRLISLTGSVSGLIAAFQAG